MLGITACLLLAQFVASLAGIESIWKTAYAGSPFNYYFLDERFARQYRTDHNCKH